MEEKERYSLEEFDDIDWELAIVDRKLSRSLTFQEIENLLNAQDKELKQSQKQLAISELEKVLDNFRNRPTYFDVARQELCLSDQDKQFIDFINSRIKELRGGENE